MTKTRLSPRAETAAPRQMEETLVPEEVVQREELHRWEASAATDSADKVALDFESSNTRATTGKQVAALDARLEGSSELHRVGAVVRIESGCGSHHLDQLRRVSLQ